MRFLTSFEMTAYHSTNTFVISTIGEMTEIYYRMLTGLTREISHFIRNDGIFTISFCTPFDEHIRHFDDRRNLLRTIIYYRM